MPASDAARDEGGLRMSYQPSGRVAWAHFVPLLVAGIVVSGGMAFLLAANERAGRPIPVLDTLAHSIPALAAVILCVYFGGVRNRAIAVTTAVFLVTVFYVGHWFIDYYQSVAQFGASAVTEFRKLTGLPGVLGLVVLRCDPSGGEFESHGLVAAILVARALEFAIVLAVAIYAARWMAGRVYFEDRHRWASSCAFGFEREELPRVRAALDADDFDALDPIEKVTITRDHRTRGGLILRVEYLPGSDDQPVFVTLEGPRLWKFGRVLAWVPLVHRWTRRWVSQRRIEPEPARRLARYVPGLKLGAPPPPPQSTDPAAAPALPYWTENPDSRSVVDSGLVSVLRESGFVGVTLVGKTSTDFRDAAVRATLALTQGAGAIDVDSIGASLCVPAEPEPAKRLKRFSRLELIATLALFSGAIVSCPLIWAASAAGGAGRGDLAIWCYLASGGFIVFSLVGLAFLAFGYRPMQMALLMRHFRRRGACLIPPHVPLPRQLVRIEDPATFHIAKYTPEDWCVALLDPYQGRLVLEGLSHRYVIRGCDVTHITPLTSNSCSLKLGYRVGDQPLELVMNRYVGWMPWATAAGLVPLLGMPFKMLIRRSPRRWGRQLATTLQFSPPPVVAPPLERTAAACYP